MSVAKYKPAKKEELLEIKGFGKHKIENYGEEILEILESIWVFVSQKKLWFI